MANDILIDSWKKSGVEPGDTLLLHSNIKRTLIRARKIGLNIGPADILQSFLDALGPKGTLLLPLFNFDFTRGITFDIRNSPSQMGILTETARLHPKAIRTGHPIYSFAILGYQQALFKSVNNRSGYGADSPFSLLRKLDGKIGVLDLEDQNSMTFYHHVEEMKHVSYRDFKDFSGLYTNEQGHTQIETYCLYVRKLHEGVRTDVNPAGEMLWSDGLYKGFRPGVETGLRTIRAREMFDYISNIIESNQALGKLYSVSK